MDAVVVQVDGGTGLWYPSKVGRRFLRNAPVDAGGEVPADLDRATKLPTPWPLITATAAAGACCFAWLR